MENEPALIRQQMQQTRTAMTEKFEALEQHVLDTVQTATCAVHDTVSTVKEAVEGTVSSVKGSIDDTMSTVKESIGGTVDSVKETFDLELQVRRHPWTLLGSALFAGFVSGKAFQRLDRPSASAHYLPSAATPARRTGESWTPARSAPPPAENRPAEAEAPGTLSTAAHSLLHKFEPEIDNLRGVAIGALFNVVKGVVRQYVPRNVEPQIVELVDNVTSKLGGKPLSGSIMEEFQGAHK